MKGFVNIVTALALLAGCEQNTKTPRPGLSMSASEQHQLAMELYGSDFYQDRQRGFDLLNRCAETSAECQYALYIVYSEGIDRPVDQLQGLAWLNLSAESGFLTAMNDITWEYATSDSNRLFDPHSAHRWAERLIDKEGLDSTIKDTIAAAYASVGQMDKAVDYQLEALDDARAEELDDTVIKAIKDRLSLYRQGYCYRINTRCEPEKPPVPNV